VQTAYQLDPLSSSVNTGLARIYDFRNENDKSIAQINKTLELDPNYAEAHFTVGMTYTKIKEYEKSEMELKKAIELSNRRPVILGMLGLLYAREGKTDEAKKLLKELESAPVNNDKLYAIAVIKNSIGQTGEALNIFEKLVAEKYGIMIYMKVQKDFFVDSDTPRYQQMLKKIGF
jgi:adenylate cyclase